MSDISTEQLKDFEQQEKKAKALREAQELIESGQRNRKEKKVLEGNVFTRLFQKIKELVQKAGEIFADKIPFIGSRDVTSYRFTKDEAHQIVSERYDRLKKEHELGIPNYETPSTEIKKDQILRSDVPDLDKLRTIAALAADTRETLFVKIDETTALRISPDFSRDDIFKENPLSVSVQMIRDSGNGWEKEFDKLAFYNIEKVSRNHLTITENEVSDKDLAIYLSNIRSLKENVLDEKNDMEGKKQESILQSDYKLTRSLCRIDKDLILNAKTAEKNHDHQDKSQDKNRDEQQKSYEQTRTYKSYEEAGVEDRMYPEEEELPEGIADVIPEKKIEMVRGYEYNPNGFYGNPKEQVRDLGLFSKKEWEQGSSLYGKDSLDETDKNMVSRCGLAYSQLNQPYTVLKGMEELSPYEILRTQEDGRQILKDLLIEIQDRINAKGEMQIPEDIENADFHKVYETLTADRYGYLYGQENFKFIDEAEKQPESADWNKIHQYSKGINVYTGQEISYQLPLYLREAQDKKFEQVLYAERTHKLDKKELPPQLIDDAYRLKLQFGKTKDLTPYEVLQTYKNGADILKESYQKLEAKQEKYPENKRAMDAIRATLNGYATNTLYGMKRSQEDIRNASMVQFNNDLMPNRAAQLICERGVISVKDVIPDFDAPWNKESESIKQPEKDIPEQDTPPQDNPEQDKSEFPVLPSDNLSPEELEYYNSKDMPPMPDDTIPEIPPEVEDLLTKGVAEAEYDYTDNDEFYTPSNDEEEVAEENTPEPSLAEQLAAANDVVNRQFTLDDDVFDHGVCDLTGDDRNENGIPDEFEH